MSTNLSVKFLRHAAPFMPGDTTVLPYAKARELEAKGVVEIAGKSAAPAIPTRAAEFDPLKSPIEEVKSFIIGRGEIIAVDAGESALRKQAAAILAKAKG